MERIACKSVFALVLLSACCETVTAKGFLARIDKIEELLNSAKQLLGDDHYHFVKPKLGKIEHTLQPLYTAMQKNEHGKLGHAAASYALHRVFQQRHGWHVTGLESNDKGFDAWRRASPTTVLEKHVPEDTVQELEQQLFTDGFGLHELAIVAATIEHFIHLEAMDNIQSLFEVQHSSMDKTLNVSQTDHTLDTYMAVYLIGHAVRVGYNSRLEKLEKVVNRMPRIFPEWEATQDFLREVRKSVAPETEGLALSDISKIVEETGERYGAFQDQQCRSMHARLFALEDTSPGGAGRIRLADFYSLALQDKASTFSDSMFHLRSMGALDETDSATPRVIITNWIYSSSNCIASSEYYEVCCINQCDPLMAQIEQETGAPEASPSFLVNLAASLRSPSTPNGKIVSTWLRHQLDEIANQHSGRVPLHGRLFAQWMHSAYPHECPFPHVSGATNPTHLVGIIQSQEAIKEVVATKEEMQSIVDSAPPRSDRILDAQAHEASSMLSKKEELVV